MNNMEKFNDKDIQVVIALQTESEVVRNQVSKEDMPLTIICDPSHEIFSLYDVESADTQEGLASKEAIAKLQHAKEIGITKIDNNKKENVLQLPATFVINKNKELEYIRYGTHAADIPEIDQLVEILDKM